MSDISFIVPTQVKEEPVLECKEEEAPQKKESEKKRKKDKAKRKPQQNYFNRMFVIPFFQNRKMFRGNNSNLKKMDTTLYKKVFFGNFKEDCNHLLPPNKNFLNEKYQNFKNIYNKIFFYKRKFKKNCNEIFEESIAKGKKVNELKKINHKNGVIQLLIQKLQNQPIKIKENNYFKDIAEEIGHDIKADFIEKIYDSIDLTNIKDFDKDKTLNNFYQRHQTKEINKKRTRKQLEKFNKSSTELSNNTDIDMSQCILEKNPTKKQKHQSKNREKTIIETENKTNESQTKTSLEANQKIKAMFEIAKNVNNIQTNGNNPILTYSQNPIKKEFEKQVVEPNQIPQTFCLKTEPTTFQPVRPFDFLLPDHVDVSESNQNVIRMTNRGILNKLNKFCSYDYDQATLSISSNCNSQDKKKFDSHPLHQNNNLIRQQKNASISKQDFLKNMMSSLIPTKRQILEKYQTAQNVSRSNSHENHHKNHHNFNGMKNYVSDFEDAKISGKNFPQNIVGFQKQNFQFNSDPQIINSNNFKANFHQMQMKTENINRNYQENYQNKNNNDKNISINNYSNQPHGTFASQNHTFIPPNISLSSQTHAIGSTHKSQTIDSKNLFYRTSQSDKYHKKQSQSPDGKSQTVYKQIFEEKNNHSKSVVERNDAPKPRNSNNFTNSTTPFSKKDSSPAFQQQQYINVPIIEKELQVQSNMMPLNIQQIYQHQYRPRPNSGYFYNNGSENNYMNNNVSSNNYCYPNNSNHYVGVNYPVQNMNPNLGYSKPNNYQTYGHVDMNGENQSAKFGLNYLPERNFGEKTRNSEYWKSPFYPYNNEN